MNSQLIDGLKNNGYYVGIIDGKECQDKQSFLVNIAKAFQFPDYYGNNLDALWECINDLEWLVESNYALMINNSKLFLSKCSRTDRNKIIDLLNDVPNEWSNVYQYRNIADFKVIYN